MLTSTIVSHLEKKKKKKKKKKKEKVVKKITKRDKKNYQKRVKSCPKSRKVASNCVINEHLTVLVNTTHK